MNEKIIKMSIVLLTAIVGGAVLVTPANIAFAQGQGNLTVAIDVDTLSKNIQDRHPILANLTTEEDKDLAAKIKGMDTKEAVKTEIALNILHLLQQYKELD
jgi:alpha-L-arabinofuranosidase